MPEHADEQIALEIAHVLYLDIVGYSKLSSKEQRVSVDALNEIVRASEQFQKAETADRLIKIPTGDGMALVFYSSPEAPAKCAVEVSRGLKGRPQLPVRMGVHSGSVSGVIDVNGRPNLAGAGLNIAQRVMDCGDAGHILVSKHAADDLDEYEHWRTRLHDLGACEVKHGVKVHVSNLWDEEVGNCRVPAKLHTQRRRVRRQRWIWPAAIALLIAAAIALGLVAQRRGKAIPPVSDRSIAVLPFKPLLAENRDPVLEVGMADTLITKLSTSRELVVPSLSSVRQARSQEDPLALGKALRVGSVLEGNVQRIGDRLRVTVRLLKVLDGSSLWAATFDEKFTDVFAMQDTIATKVAEALALRLSGEERKQFAKRYTENLEAYQLYLTGRYHWSNISPPELQKAIGYFKQAIEVDPRYALAYFGLAEAYRASSIVSDARPTEIMPAARAAAVKAIELDESLAEPHFTLAMIHIFFDWDWAGAQKEAKRAIELNPNLAWGHMALGHTLSDMGQHEEAIAEITRARQLEPISLLLNMLEGARYFYARRYQEAEAPLRKALELNPNFWSAHRYLGHVAVARNELAAASEHFTKASEYVGATTAPRAMLGYIAARSGDEAKARSILTELESRAAERYVPGTNVAVVYLGLGQTDEALRWLERGCNERDVQMQFLKVDPIWDELRSEPRFASILQRMGLN